MSSTKHLFKPKIDPGYYLQRKTWQPKSAIKLTTICWKHMICYPKKNWQIHLVTLFAGWDIEWFKKSDQLANPSVFESSKMWITTYTSNPKEPVLKWILGCNNMFFHVRIWMTSKWNNHLQNWLSGVPGRCSILGFASPFPLWLVAKMKV